MYFEWKDKYSINFKKIDDQHKKLFEIGRKISNLVFSNDPLVCSADIISIVHDLNSYTKYHFKYEEKCMKESGYPHYESHKNIHDEIIVRIQSIEKKIPTSLQKETLMELINLIFDWISHHILKDDKKLAGYLE